MDVEAAEDEADDDDEDDEVSCHLGSSAFIILSRTPLPLSCMKGLAHGSGT